MGRLVIVVVVVVVVVGVVVGVGVKSCYKAYNTKIVCISMHAYTIFPFSVAWLNLPPSQSYVQIHREYLILR